MSDELLTMIRSLRAGLSDADMFRALGLDVPGALLAAEAEAVAPKKRKKPLPVPKYTDQAVAAIFRSRYGMPRAKLTAFNTLDDLTTLIERYVCDDAAVNLCLPTKLSRFVWIFTVVRRLWC